MKSDNASRNSIFISYSHKDSDWLISLKRHFKPFEEEANFWDDTKIKPGGIWKNEINDAITNSKIAILLVSADFLASDFIRTEELPKLLSAASEKGKMILTIYLSPCAIEFYPEIAKYQFLNDPNNPVSSMNLTQRESLWVQTVRHIVLALRGQENNTSSSTAANKPNKKEHDTEKVRMKIERTKTFTGAAIEIEIRVDGEVKASLKRGRSVEIEIKSGNHTLQTTAYSPELYDDSGGSPAKDLFSNKIEQYFEGGKTYEYECGFYGFLNSKFLLIPI
jgi:hypothetical protein